MEGDHRDNLWERPTPREREICEALAECFTNREIAEQLGISSNTVKNQVHAILKKLRLRSRGEVIGRYARHPPLWEIEGCQ